MTAIDILYNLYRKHPVITTDSRNCPQDSLFFALKGTSFNGNEYAAKALENGAAYAIIDEPEYQIDNRYFLVDDVLQALQSLAKHHRSKLTIPVIGITGTNGKTTTKELTQAVLSTQFNTLATEGNLNNHIGVPLTLLKINNSHEMAIIEMGANHPGEIAFLCNMVAPDYGLITNVGKAHLEGFGSLQGVIKTKSELYESLQKNNGTAFLNEDSDLLNPASFHLSVVGFGTKGDFLVTGNVDQCAPNLEATLHIRGEEIQVKTQLIGGYNLANMLAASCIGTYFKVSTENIKKALENYQPQNKRSQLLKTERNTLVLDAYNANPTSMLAALTNFKEMTGNHKVLILGDMRELGAESLHEHEQIIRFIEEVPFKQVYLVGHEFNSISHPFMGFDDSASLAVYLETHPIQDSLILVKGSRGIALEKVIPTL